MEQFKVLTTAKDLFLKIASGNHHLALRPIDLHDHMELDEFTIFGFEPKKGNRQALEHARNCAYEEILIKTIDYANRQKEYCFKMTEKLQYDVDKYAQDNTMTNEQMSGYYQGRLEGNVGILNRIEDLSKE